MRGIWSSSNEIRSVTLNNDRPFLLFPSFFSFFLITVCLFLVFAKNSVSQRVKIIKIVRIDDMLLRKTAIAVGSAANVSYLKRKGHEIGISRYKREYW